MELEKEDNEASIKQIREIFSGKIISNASTYLLNQINISDNKSGGN